MNKTIITCLLALSVTEIYAKEMSSAFYTNAEFYSDSDDLAVDQWSIAYKQSEGIFSDKHNEEPEQKILWGLKASRSNINQAEKDNYRGQSITATVGQKFNKNLSAEVSLGNSKLENNTTRRDNDLATFGFKAKAKIHEKVVIHVKHERDYLYNNAIIEDDTGKLIHGETSNIGVFFRPHNKWRVEGKINHVELNDNNSSDQLSGALLYGISSGWPWIWTGIKAEKLKYNQNKNSYWTPKDYQSIGLTLDSSFPVNNDVSMNFGANINRSKEGSNPEGTGYSVSAGAYWKIADSINVAVTGHLLESTQETSEWKQDGVNLSINMKSY